MRLTKIMEKDITTPILGVGFISIFGIFATGFANDSMIGDGYEKRCDEIRADFAKVAEDFSTVKWPDGYNRRHAVVTEYINAKDVGGFFGFQNRACTIVLDN